MITVDEWPSLDRDIEIKRKNLEEELKTLFLVNHHFREPLMNIIRWLDYEKHDLRATGRIEQAKGLEHVMETLKKIATAKRKARA